MSRRAHLSALRTGLENAADTLRGLDVPVPPLEGKLLRPLVAFSCVPAERRTRLDGDFWAGAIAVQMVHEASLLHDDIVDGAARRRGRPTMVAQHGVGRALVTGDQYLTAAYRAAAAARSPVFLDLFVEAVERTVAGEVAQGRAVGSELDARAYASIVRDKSGQLFRAATALHACLDGGDTDAFETLGVRIGTLYQRVDDLLDYCASDDPAKPRFQDYRQEKWTWVFERLGIDRFGRPLGEVEALVTGREGRSGLSEAVSLLADEASAIAAAHRSLVPGDELLPGLVEGWVARANDAVESLRGRASASVDAPLPPTAATVEGELRRRALEIGPPERWTAYFAEHSRTFRFAARLFPSAPMRDVTGVYAFCRFTDDLADEPDPSLSDDRRRARLARWKELARDAYGGRGTGIPLLDEVIGGLPERDVPLHYVEELIDGVASDIGGVRIADPAELRRYTYRVASVVGGWITRLFGVHDPDVLVCAYDLGHAMQLTNILRDVGEDARNGRVYLPARTMEAFGVSHGWLQRFAAGEELVTPAWTALVEELAAEADRHYDRALVAVPHLPRWYQRPVVVAARVYQGIHDRIRASDHDTATRRAYTTVLDKARLGMGALWELRGLRRAAERGRLPAVERPTSTIPSRAAAHRS